MVYPLIITDADGVDVRALDDYELDLAYGDDENNLAVIDNTGGTIDAGAYVYIDGSDIGGTIDGIELDTTTGTMTMQGRSLTGILAQKVIVPDAGQSHLTVSGDANAVLGQLIERLDIGDVFVASTAASGISVRSYSFERYVDAYKGIRDMLAAAGGKLKMRRTSGDRFEMYAEAVVVYGDEVSSEIIDFVGEKWTRKTNHLIALGKGEGASRTVIHRYADADGVVSSTQSLFGVDEIAEVYDASNIEDDELAEDATKKLADEQNIDSVDVSIGSRDDITFNIGDKVTGFDAERRIRIDATISKKIVKVSKGAMTTSYTAGSIKVTPNRS